ncbi:EndoU domain-containing protein [uncultured Clostridium sp.]|uniref:EndoU domain-containing protein n=1 Tax=uncultured Clostridium sp. TaxID=59620 RepID=UPI00263138D2|nr:EndoU domain-containing protein [uncultured Clostridium sp.]
MHFYLILLAIFFSIAFFAFNSFKSKPVDEHLSNECVIDSRHKKYGTKVLEELHNTNLFLHNAIEHIFLGSINKDGLAEGFHYNNIKGINSTAISETKTKPNSYGVYKAKAIIHCMKKSDCNGYSTFFPNSMSPQEITNSIIEAHKSRRHIDGNIYIGRANSGIEIEMYLTHDAKIISAFPKY